LVFKKLLWEAILFPFARTPREAYLHGFNCPFYKNQTTEWLQDFSRF
jgi:hypothetical protein